MFVKYNNIDSKLDICKFTIRYIFYTIVTYKFIDKFDDIVNCFRGYSKKMCQLGEIYSKILEKKAYNDINS
jgi:hypothetical protein